MIEQIFKAYFEQERDISNIDELVKIATEAGLEAV
jgi:predicted DsbA family dithiol-disulfide isomerase